MAIQNPEKECKTTPEQFSDTSRIRAVEKDEVRSGIILDNPEEVAQALRVYGGGSVRGSRATQQNLMDNLGGAGGGLGAAILGPYMAGSGDSFTERLAEEMESELKSGRGFHRDFDYDAMGTKFFKTMVKGTKVGDKYVLGLYAAYVGSAPEEKLAETLGKPLALVSAQALGRLTIVDDWWFNVDLEDILQKLPIAKRQVKKVLESYQPRSDVKPDLRFQHQGQKFSLGVYLADCNPYLSPESGKWDDSYRQVRGPCIVGGAWSTWDEIGNTKVPPRRVEPAVCLSVSLPGERYTRPVAVTDDQMQAVRAARDYIGDCLSVA